jgi:hypothetical protein
MCRWGRKVGETDVGGDDDDVDDDDDERCWSPKTFKVLLY